MALGADYVTIAELKSEFGIGDSEDDTELTLAVSSASAWVTTYCERDFNQAGSASARIFYGSHVGVVHVDDISTTDGLIVKSDGGDDGTFESTWTSSDYQLEPLNGMRSGLTGWPYTAIRFVEASYVWPRGRRAGFQITANWGWPAVPTPIKKATLVMAARLYKRRYSPEGVLGGFDSFGPVRVGSRLDPDVAQLLAPYRKHAVLVA